jgi:3-dehydroquinate dehydratase-2
MLNITIINGPNLNLLGKREPGIYGNESFEDYLVQMKQAFPQVNFTYFQSNVEGELVNAIQQYGFNQDGMIAYFYCYWRCNCIYSNTCHRSAY